MGYGSSMDVLSRGKGAKCEKMVEQCEACLLCIGKGHRRYVAGVRKRKAGEIDVLSLGWVIAEMGVNSCHSLLISEN